MAREKVDNKLNVVIGTKAQVEADNTIPENSIVVVTDEELTESDIPTLSPTKITQDELNRFVTDNEKTTWNNKVDKNNAITAGTKTKITYDEKGLVTSGADLEATDIPELPQSKITNLGTDLDSKVNKNADIVGATKTKITYDSKGLVTGGADLVATDIPQLSPSKITQDANNRFVTDNEKSTWNEKQDALTAGDGISISGNIISATGVDLSNYYDKDDIDDMIGDIETALDAILGV